MGEMAESSSTPGTGPDPEAIAVDESLITEMLSMTPEERLRHNDRMIRTAEILRRGIDAKPSPRR